MSTTTMKPILPARPRLTDRVLRGIIELQFPWIARHVSGEDCDGEDDDAPDAAMREQIADAKAAVAWAHAMQRHRAAVKSINNPA